MDGDPREAAARLLTEPPPAGAKPMADSLSAATLDWPFPPYLGREEGCAASMAEPCVIELGGSGAISGALLALSGTERCVHIKVAATVEPRVVPFADITSLRLIEPWPLPEPKRELSFADEAAPVAPLSAIPAATRFQVESGEGQVIEGMTIGRVESAAGTYIFRPIGAGRSVSREFYPAKASSTWEFGPPIGEVLIEQGVATTDQVAEATEVQEELRTRKLGDMLVEQRILSPADLVRALDMQARMPMMRIGEALLSLGLVRREQLAAALEMQKSDRSAPLGELLVRLKMVSRDELRIALSRKMGFPIVDLNFYSPQPDALRLLPVGIAQRLRVVPLMVNDVHLVVGMDDVTRHKVVEEIEFVTQRKVARVLAIGADLDGAIESAYLDLDSTHKPEIVATPTTAAQPGKLVLPNEALRIAESMSMLDAIEPLADENVEENAINQSDNALVRLIHQTILAAHSEGASDIHIECYPGKENVRIRFRKDGQLRSYLELPYTYRNAMIARIKIMCDLDISEKRKPQDGKINFSRYSRHHALELRVATIPTTNGLEDVVMRLLASAKPIPLDNLSLTPENLTRLKAAVLRPYGLVLCVGPTGSGKTTTLHSALGFINRPETKIWTAEDPVEITQAGLRQVQVNAKIDWTFARALRSFLRADPDVIMVGEVRDAETAHMVVEASLTGHLVLSTLHTNSAVETVIRLVDMGVDAFNFADALLAIVAQRLVRRVCSECRQELPMPKEIVDELAQDYIHSTADEASRPPVASLTAGWIKNYGKDGQLMSYRGRGCRTCSGTGLKGRLGLHELLTADRELRHLIQKEASPAELQVAASRNGMRTLRQDGILKVLQGLTTIEEVRATSNE